jgi:L-seryl-tRNA(Ser) seleniumtransferase
MFSGDKLIGGPQAGIIVGRSECIERIRKHPLARALRADKTCLMGLERTLILFRDEEVLVREHPLYRMLAMDVETLETRARELAEQIRAVAPCMACEPVESVGYLGSGSCPMEGLTSRAVRVTTDAMSADQLARHLRLDDACVFSRVEGDAVWLDVRTLWPHQIARVAEAMARICASLRE